jgi:dihydropteroate synthase
MLDLRQLRELSDEYTEALNLPVQSFSLSERLFDFTNTKAVMGVVNLSLDSWYRESVCPSTETAIHRARVLVSQGADLVDVGAESTLAQAARSDDTSQKQKMLPVIRALRSEGILVSAESYTLEVARACLEAGANVLNLTGTQDSETIYRSVADHGAGVVICYVQGPHVRAVKDLEFEDDPVTVMESTFAREVELAVHCGVQRIFLDPGLGFYYGNLQDGTKRVRHQMRTFLNTFRLRRLGWPICHALPHAFEFFREEVRCAEPFFAVLAALGGTDLFRTHEVSRTKAVLDTLAAY